ncbi:MAG: glycosyltransferase [Acidobacteriota bacterium]
MSSEDNTLLDENAVRDLEKIGKADILIGIPSFNNARTIGQVVRAVSAGLAKYFREAHAVIVNSDGGSTDGTCEVVESTEFTALDKLMVRHRLHPVHKIITPYHGMPGKGSAFRTIFKIAQLLDVKACAVFDSDLRSITPEWVELLAGPILKQGYDYTAPLYRRHKYDGTITNSIVYPVTRAVYGKRIRQPIGGDFGFSGKLAASYLAKDVWDSDVARYGIDIWMTTTALAEGFKVCQAYLGAKIHDPKDPSSDLSAMLMQVVSSVFGLMDTYYEVWRGIRGSEPVPSFGFEYSVGLDPVHVNTERMIEHFRHAVRELDVVWKDILEASSLARVRALADSRRHFFPNDLWAAVVYDFALAYHHRVMNPEHLMKSLTPLYLGRTASFVLETEEASSDEVELRVEELAVAFEAKKDRLLAGWMR